MTAGLLPRCIIFWSGRWEIRTSAARSDGARVMDQHAQVGEQSKALGCWTSALQRGEGSCAALCDVMI